MGALDENIAFWTHCNMCKKFVIQPDFTDKLWTFNFSFVIYLIDLIDFLLPQHFFRLKKIKIFTEN